MKRKILIIAMVVMAAIMLAASINMAFATTTYYDYEHAGALCLINAPSHPSFLFLVFGQMVGNYYCGVANRFMFEVYSSSLATFVPVAGYEDNPTRSAFSASLGLPTVEHIVAHGQIGVFRVGKFEMVYWTIPLEIPVAPFSTSVITLPPGMLMLQGYGEKLSASVGPVAIGPNGWYVEYSYHYYDATANLFCPGWNYWGPVGLSSGALQTTVVVDRVWTWTHA